MARFLKNPHNNKAWEKLKKEGYNPRKFMYMYSKNSIQHFFKHIDTRKYITIYVLADTE